MQFDVWRSRSPVVPDNRKEFVKGKTWQSAAVLSADEIAKVNREIRACASPDQAS
jgi:hypothetical protein